MKDFADWQSWTQHPIHGLVYGQGLKTLTPFPGTYGTVFVWQKGTGNFVKTNKTNDLQMKLNKIHESHWDSLCVIYLYHYPNFIEDEAKTTSKMKAESHSLPVFLMYHQNLLNAWSWKMSFHQSFLICHRRERNQHHRSYILSRSQRGAGWRATSRLSTPTTRICTLFTGSWTGNVSTDCILRTYGPITTRFQSGSLE